jgi:hypothetical protein
MFHFQMQMYDLRFPSKRGILSNSCLTFEDYENEFRHQIDVNCGLGLVASSRYFLFFLACVPANT